LSQVNATGFRHLCPIQSTIKFITMGLPQYIAAFWAGAFLANFIPHFVHGASGNKFPTPFSNPGGIGLSSPTVNVIWALFNLLVAYFMFTVSGMDTAHPLSLLACFAGISVLSIYTSIRFTKKHKE
jgi:hypothetical protein